LLRGIDRQLGLTERLAAARQDQRHPSSIAPPLRDLLAPRLDQIAAGYADGKEANRLRPAPRLPLSLERPPREPPHAWASAPPLSRLDHRVDRTDLSRLTPA
jgi:hypothetical protein